MFNSAFPILSQLAGRITLDKVPFSDRGSRLMVFRKTGGLYVRMAERWVKWVEQDYHTPEREPVVDDWVLTDAHGARLAATITSYPHVLEIQTERGRAWLAFVDEETLYLKLPPGRVGIAFSVLADQGATDSRGGVFKGDPGHATVHRNVAYTTNAQILANALSPAGPGYTRVELQVDADPESALLINITPRLGFRRVAPRPERVLDEAERSWGEWFAAAPRVDSRFESQYYYAWWVLRAGLISPRYYLTREALVPSLYKYIGVWQWDAYFHALAYRHLDPDLAEEQFRAILDHQRADGMLPDAVHDEGVIDHLDLPGSNVTVDVTKPPVIGWAAEKLYASTGRRDFLLEVYEPICRWTRWWLDRRDGDRDGIMEYEHPNSSGLDDSPLWDDGMPVESPDLNTYLVLQMDALARMAEKLKLPNQAAEWRTRSEELTARMIEQLYDPDAGLFWATRDHEPIRTRTPFNLYPLLTGRLPREFADRLVQHLRAENEFATSFPVPTVARDDPHFDPQTMWRGPTWININYFLIDGLVRAGYPDLARELRDKTLDLVLRHADIYEYYNPETGNPPPDAAPAFGWSCALFIDLAIQASRGEII